MKNYYGKPRLYRDFKILQLQGLTLGLGITIQVETFKGDHNPTYRIEIMKFNIVTGEIELIDYKSHLEK